MGVIDMSRHFAIDLGAESGRCVVGILQDGQLVLDELCRFPTKAMTIQGGLHWNIYRFYEEILAGLRIYSQKYGPELDSIGVDTWGVDFGLLDQDGRLLGLPFCYRDSRNEGTEEILANGLGKDRIYELTGIQFLTFNTLNQLAGAVNRKETQPQKAASLLFIPDLLHFLLGARKCCEFTDASISQLVNIHEKNWDNEIFDSFHIPANIQEPICFAGDRIGTLSDDIACQTGIQPGVPIIAPAVHDTASAAAAIPARGENWAYISSGTWSLVGVELEKPVINEESFAMNISNSGAAFGKSLFLKNVMGLWIIQQCRAFWGIENPNLTYPMIEDLAASAPSYQAFIDPDQDCFFHLGDMPQKICAYLKESRQGSFDPADIGTISRIVFESLALKYRYVIEQITHVTGKKIDVIHIVGGGCKNLLLNQFTANMMQIPVLAGPSECTAMGNLLIQAYGCGLLASHDEIRAVVRNSENIRQFNPQDGSAGESIYQRFLETIHGKEV